MGLAVYCSFTKYQIMKSVWAILAILAFASIAMTAGGPCCKDSRVRTHCLNGKDARNCKYIKTKGAFWYINGKRIQDTNCLKMLICIVYTPIAIILYASWDLLYPVTEF